MTSRNLLPDGSLLISAPQMLDGNFMHTVVVVVKHNAEGAYGFVLNHFTGDVSSDLVEPETVLAQVDLPVRDGGPVGRNQLQFLHRRPEALPGALEVVEGLYLGGDLDALGDAGLGLADVAEDLRLFQGYSGWGPGQLEGELAAGGWLPLEARPEVIFEAGEREPTWRRVLRSLGDTGLGLSQQPPDPSWN